MQPVGRLFARNTPLRLPVTGSFRFSSAQRIAAAALLFAVSGLPNLAVAATEVVSLERLGVEDVILLPTISSQYITHFTYPRTWKMSPSSKVEVSFQHAIQLLPENSWLQVILNDKVIKHVALTRANVDNTLLTIPLPVAMLQDSNTLAFRVQQHYAHHCEDPLDKSLWTQILPATKLVFNYEPVAPEVTLNGYPYPVIDPLTYSPAKLRYVVSSEASPQSLQAMALLNINLAQHAGKHEVSTRATFNAASGPDDEHVLYVGTAEELSRAGNVPALSGAYALHGGRWAKVGQELSDDQGVILFARAPGSSRHAALIVSGNTPQAVLKAARFLTTNPRPDGMTGNALETPSGWVPPDTRTGKVPRFVENESRSFREMEFPTQEVHKINAPPIVYKVPVMTAFRQNGGRMWLDLSYSYGPGMNPMFSSLELRMNNVSIGNIPLDNPEGEPLMRASLPISGELIRPKNELVAQFHMMPDKYGWCVDNYVDKAWGKILDDSRFRVEGRPEGRLPDTALLGAAMFPYSREDNLEHLQLILPSAPDASVLSALLGFTTRLGRTTLADTDLRLSLGVDASVENDKNAVIFRRSSDALHLPDGARLSFQSDGQTRRLVLRDPGTSGDTISVSAEISNSPGAAYLEQYQVNGDHTVSVITAKEANAFVQLAKLFEADKAFERWNDSALLNAVTPLPSDPVINAVAALAYHQESAVTPTGWQGWLLGIWNGIWSFPGMIWRSLMGLWPWH
jgi:cellulose synthase operon protein B